MKKYFVLIVCLMFAISMSACTTNTQNNSMVQAKRRFADYLPDETKTSQEGVVDLSEGPRLRYDRNMGPKDLNFDIKIVNPY